LLLLQLLSQLWLLLQPLPSMLLVLLAPLLLVLPAPLWTQLLVLLLVLLAPLSMQPKLLPTQLLMLPRLLSSPHSNCCESGRLAPNQKRPPLRAVFFLSGWLEKPPGVSGFNELKLSSIPGGLAYYFRSSASNCRIRCALAEVARAPCAS
jgi:hypothetical protein